MPNLIGDELMVLHRGGCDAIEWEIDRGGGAQWYSLQPVGWDGALFEEQPTVDRGLDGKIDEKWWTYVLRLRFYQVDEETLADLYSGALDPLLRTTGIPTRITLMTGQIVTLTMTYTKRMIAPGYDSAAYVELIGMSRTGLSIYQ